jgi:serine/threonine protein kinase
MSLQFVVVAGPDRGRTFTIQPGDGLLLGRGEKPFYRLTDPRVSRNHCQVLLEGEQVTVLDNGGSGGVRVNGQPVQRQALRLGDLVAVGDTQLRLLMGDFPLDVALGAVAAAPPPPPAPPSAESLNEVRALTGQTLSHYEIGHVLGEGANGIVFFATDTKDNRPVALKVLRPEFSQDDEEVQRFVRGIKTVLPLRHPNLVTLYGAGKTGRLCWVAMEYIAGEAMTQVIERIGVAGMLDWKYAYKVALHVGRALDYAHGLHVIHRNVTPSNILLQATDKVVKLGDLMLAKALEGTLAKQITRPGELVGAVEYMAPERTRGDPQLDGRTDLYGLGATLYALLTGRPPFEGKTLIEKITRIRQHEPVRPTQFQRSVPGAFEDVVLKLLAKRPEDRPQTTQELLAALERVGRFHGVKA